MRIKELAKYCEEVKVCRNCKHESECKVFSSYIEDISPRALVRYVEENKDFSINRTKPHECD